ncbi:hypothetical protein L2E82_49910 [Cichorium intybus]|uniref:Uncharacterized protein n=1 Tax=Cichorium intybus TaxID=13427 RepID=A0ACB8Z2N4_CICIN|nr:hypothetical protein L2E82_49910 [Cichorium intybus]
MRLVPLAGSSIQYWPPCSKNHQFNRSTINKNKDHKSQETTERVENVAEEEVVGDNTTPDSTTFDVFENVDNVDLVMSEPIPSPDHLVEKEVEDGAVSDSTNPSPTTPEISEIVDTFEIQNLVMSEPIPSPDDMVETPNLQTADGTRDASKMRFAEQSLGPTLGALHVTPVMLKRHRRKDQAWRFKATSKHSREIIRKRQRGNDSRTEKPFDLGKLEYGINEGTVVTGNQQSQMAYDPP